jgi:hypothetical protein
MPKGTGLTFARKSEGFISKEKKWPSVPNAQEHMANLRKNERMFCFKRKQKMAKCAK